jgi:hypothetical protein
MRTTISQKKLFLTPIIAILFVVVFTRASPAVASTSTTPSTGVISGCGTNNNSGCTYWWSWSLTGNMIPGQTVYFTFNVYNSDPSLYPVHLDSLRVQTPWTNYTDPSLPQQINTGYNYYNEIAITIPADQAPGSVPGTLQFTGQFSDMTPWCSDTGGACSDSATFTIVADPAILQTQITSLNNQVTGLNSQVSSLQGQVASLNNQIATLTAQLSQANGNLSAAKQTIATDKDALTQAQNALSTAQSTLASTQMQLTSKEAQLASTQSSLNSANDVYLPIAAVIPGIVAVLFAFLYFRKKTVVTPVH